MLQRQREEAERKLEQEKKETEEIRE